MRRTDETNSFDYLQVFDIKLADRATSPGLSLNDSTMVAEL